MWGCFLRPGAGRPEGFMKREKRFAFAHSLGECAVAESLCLLAALAGSRCEPFGLSHIRGANVLSLRRLCLFAAFAAFDPLGQKLLVWR